MFQSLLQHVYEFLASINRYSLGFYGQPTDHMDLQYELPAKLII